MAGPPLTILAANTLTGFAPRTFTLEDGPATGEEALALAGLLGGAVGLTETWLLDGTNREALAAFLRSCGGFRALLLT